MRIVQLPHFYHPSIGGVQALVRSLSEALVRAGDEVTVMTSNLCSDGQMYRQFYDPDPDNETDILDEMLGGVRIRRFPVGTTLQRVLYRWPHRILPGSVYSGLRKLGMYRYFGKQPFCPSIIAALARNKPDLAVVNGIASPFSYYCYLVNRLSGLPYVVVPTLHIEARWTDDPVAMHILRGASRLIAHTSFEKDILVAAGIDADRVDVVEVGIDLAKTGHCPDAPIRRNPGEPPVVTYMGRLARNKGIDTLIRAMPAVWRHHPRARLVLAGAANNLTDGYLRPELDRLQKADQDNVEVVRNFDESQKASILESCSVFALPSIDESFGISYLEAWAYRKPVIAVRDSAPASFIDHARDGLLVAVRNPPELASAIVSLLDSAEQRRRMGNSGYAKLESRFSLGEMVNRTRSCYQRALQDIAE